VYFLLIQLGYFLWAGFLNAISRKIHSLKVFSASLSKFSVYFHELIHYLIAKILFQPVKLSDIVIVGSNGLLKLTPRNGEGLTFIQSLAIGLSPAIVCTIIILQIINRILTIWNNNWIYGLFLLLIGLSLLQVCTPSFMDLKNIFSSAYHRPFTCIRQISMILFGYFFFLEYNGILMDNFTFIPNILYREPIALIAVILFGEILISFIFICFRYIGRKVVSTADFSGNNVQPLDQADELHLSSTIKSKKSRLTSSNAERDLFSNIQ
jgi:hypothetical protein